MSSNMPDERTDANESGHGNFFPRQERKNTVFPSLLCIVYTSYNVVYKQLTLGFIRPRSLVQKRKGGGGGGKNGSIGGERRGPPFLCCTKAEAAGGERGEVEERTWAETLIGG